MGGRYAVLAFLLLLFWLQLLGKHPSNNTIEQRDIQYDTINFAWETVPFDQKHFFNQEKFDRELAITQLDIPQFVMIHKRELQYLPYITKQLRESGIPEDFKYLAIAESALRNVAYSSAWAAGIRQFIPSTAKKYGLTIDAERDERLDFEKSTDAAIAYLKDLYEYFGDWTLVAAAYNRWENGLQRDINRQHTSWYYDLWLNTETSRYVFRILAIKELMEHKPQYFNMQVLWSQYALPKTKIIKIKAIDDIAIWAKDHGYTYGEIRYLNPRIRGNTLSPNPNKRKIKVLK